MTWIEITFLVLLFGAFVFGLISDFGENGGGPPMFFFFPLFFAMLLGVLPSLIVTANTPTTLVREESLEFLSKTIVDGKMVIITNQADTVTFTSYADITDINSGKLLVKRFYKKDVYYGPDKTWNSIEVKK